MRRFFSTVLVYLVLLCLLGTKSVFAQTDNLQASINGNNPFKPVLTLTNTSNTSCQVALTDTGTVAITQLQQDGQVIKPVVSEAAYEEAIDALIASKLHTLKPGESAQIPLPVYHLGSNYFLKIVTWAPGIEPFDSIYTLNSTTKPLSFELNYSIPISVTQGPSLCSNAYVNTISTSTPSTTIPWIFLMAIILFIILILGSFFLFINKLRRSATAAIFVILGLTCSMFHASPAEATVNPGSLGSQWNTCANIFNNNKDITGPVVNAVTDPNVTVNLVQTNNPTGDTQRTGPNSFIIYWNPNSTYHYVCGGSTNPCASVYHEMFHVSQMIQGTNNPKECADSGIPTNEVEATKAENQLRERLGLTQRTCYGNDKLPKDCGITPTPTPPPSPNGPSGDFNGDTHLITFDGTRYDFQGVGEFIAAQDTSGTYEVQVRQQPWFSSKQVSILTAVAMKVGNDKLELQQYGATMNVLLNGKKQIYQKMKLSNGGLFTPYTPSQAFVSWADGSSALVTTIGKYGLHLTLSPLSIYVGKLEGLLGNDNGNPHDDLHLNGNNQIVQPTFANLYPRFADSWRVTDKSSLFTYDPGKNTSSYTDKSFPYTSIILSQLPNYSLAQAICKSVGLTDPIILQNCILDVSLTGRPEFATAELSSQNLPHTVKFADTTWNLSATTPNETIKKTFTAKAGDKVFVDAHSSITSYQCLLQLVDPSGKVLSTGCIDSGKGYIPETLLPTSGTYTLAILLNKNLRGSINLQLFFDQDKNESIIPDGPAITTIFDKPGETAQYTFQGKLGQQVFVNIPFATLPDQCDIELQAPPTNYILTSGCVTNGTGFIKTTTLPITGTYIIKIAPPSDNTGQVKLNLVSPTVQDQTILLNGPSVTATMSKPGSSAMLHFSGKAGQRVFVDLSKSTFSNLCDGRVTLLGSQGETLGYSCLGNGNDALAYNNGTVLPTTGVYTILVNPNDALTGSLTIKMYTK